MIRFGDDVHIYTYIYIYIYVFIRVFIITFVIMTFIKTCGYWNVHAAPLLGGGVCQGLFAKQVFENAFVKCVTKVATNIYL